MQSKQTRNNFDCMSVLKKHPVSGRFRRLEERRRRQHRLSPNTREEGYDCEDDLYSLWKSYHTELVSVISVPNVPGDLNVTDTQDTQKEQGRVELTQFVTASMADFKYICEEVVDGLTAKQLHKRHLDDLPMLVYVSRGFLSSREETTFSVGQVLKLHEVRYQERALVHDKKKNTLSIPLDCDHLFFIDHDKSRTYTLAEVARLCVFPVVVTFADPSVNFSMDNTISHSLTSLKIIKVYAETYFVANNIYQGEPLKEVISIPLYLKEVRFQRVKGLTGQGIRDGGQAELQRMLRPQAVSRLDHSDKDIVQLSEKPLSASDNIYKKIETIKYIFTKRRRAPAPLPPVPPLPPTPPLSPSPPPEASVYQPAASAAPAVDEEPTYENINAYIGHPYDRPEPPCSDDRLCDENIYDAINAPEKKEIPSGIYVIEEDHKTSFSKKTRNPKQSGQMYVNENDLGERKTKRSDPRNQEQTQDLYVNELEPKTKTEDPETPAPAVTLASELQRALQKRKQSVESGDHQLLPAAQPDKMVRKQLGTKPGRDSDLQAGGNSDTNYPPWNVHLRKPAKPEMASKPGTTPSGKKVASSIATTTTSSSTITTTTTTTTTTTNNRSTGAVSPPLPTRKTDCISPPSGDSVVDSSANITTTTTTTTTDTGAVSASPIPPSHGTPPNQPAGFKPKPAAEKPVRPSIKPKPSVKGQAPAVVVPVPKSSRQDADQSHSEIKPSNDAPPLPPDRSPLPHPADPPSDQSSEQQARYTNQLQMAVVSPSRQQTSSGNASEHDAPPAMGTPLKAPQTSPRDRKVTEKREKEKEGGLKPLQDMTIADVQDLLSLLNMAKYQEKFDNDRVDGVLLGMLGEVIFKEDYHMSRPEIIRLNAFVQHGHLPK